MIFDVHQGWELGCEICVCSGMLFSLVWDKFLVAQWPNIFLQRMVTISRATETSYHSDCLEEVKYRISIKKYPEFSRFKGIQRKHWSLLSFSHSANLRALDIENKFSRNFKEDFITHDLPCFPSVVSLKWYKSLCLKLKGNQTTCFKRKWS